MLSLMFPADPADQLPHAGRHKDSLQIWDLKATRIYPVYNLDDLMTRRKYFRNQKARSRQLILSRANTR